MLLRAAVNAGEGKKPEVEPSFIDPSTSYFLRYYISGIRSVLVQRVPSTLSQVPPSKNRAQIEAGGGLPPICGSAAFGAHFIVNIATPLSLGC